MVSEVQGFQEKRKNMPDLELIINLLRTLDDKVDANTQKFQDFEAEFTVMKPKLEEVLSLLERSKGVIWFFRACIYVLAPVGTFYIWIRNHVKFLD